MEHGLHTMLYKYFDEDGIELSGGEAQKLAIARIIYKAPAIYILDEPTAALDPIAEYEVYRQFANTIQGRTSLYISHRLSSINICNKIAVFDNGHIIESGTFEELMKKDGLFALMYKTQSQHYF